MQQLKQRTKEEQVKKFRGSKFASRKEEKVQQRQRVEQFCWQQQKATKKLFSKEY